MTIIIPHGFEPNYTLGFLKGLSANGIQPTVISSDTDHVRLLENGFRSINLRGSQEHSRGRKVKAANLLKYFFKIFLYLYRNKRSIIHFTGLFRNEIILFEGIVLSLCFKIFSSRYIYTVHNVLPHSKEGSGFFKWIYRYIYRFPEILLVHTHQGKQQLMEHFFVPEKKIIVISIGLNEEMPITDLSCVEARQRLGFDNEDKVILFFGKADEYKGLDTLLEAFDQVGVHSAKLLISTWFPNCTYREKIVSMIDRARQSKNIHLREEFVPNEEVEVLFKSADVLALPYRNIYQSGVVFLCYNFGLPIVATDVGSLREFVEEGMGIITRTNDTQGVVDSLRLFFEIQSRFRREEIVEKTKKYKWENICKVLVPLYR
jgi:glycosyltransferase involved in cell wall biosynthesis